MLTRIFATDPHAGMWADLAATDYLMHDRPAAAAALAKSMALDSNYVRSQPGLMQMWRNVAPENAGR